MMPNVAVHCRDAVQGHRWSRTLSASGSAVRLIDELDQLDSSSDVLLTEVPDDSASLRRNLEVLDRGGGAALIVDTPELQNMVDLLQLPAVRAVIVRDRLDTSLLTHVAARLTWGNIFGLAKVIGWGVRIHSEVISGHDDRVQAMAALARFVASLRLRAKYREAIELVVDELLMNALYDAPMSPQNASAASGAGASPVSLERPTMLQYACDGSRVVVSVRDTFGSLEPHRVLAALARCLRSAEPLQREAGGAGLGLYLVTQHVTELTFNILPGVATEVIAVIDLDAPRQRLMHLGFYRETLGTMGAADRPGEPAARRAGAFGVLSADGGARLAPRAVQLTLLASVVILLVAGLVLVWPALVKPPRGSLRVSTVPPGGSIRVNGATHGVANAPLAISDLTADKAYVISATMKGYRAAREVVTVSPGETTSVTLRLQRRGGRLRVTSTPPGASISIDGRATSRSTPAAIVLSATKQAHELELQLHGYAPFREKVQVAPGQTMVYHARLDVDAGFAKLSLRSRPSGARLWVNDVDSGKKTPIDDHVLRANKKYAIKLTLAGRVPWTKQWTPRAGARRSFKASLPRAGELTIAANVAAKATVAGRELKLPVKKALLAPGEHLVRLRGWRPRVDHSFKVKIRPGKTTVEKLQFGFVSVKPRGWQVLFKGARTSLLALLPGRHQLTLANRRKKQKLSTRVVVRGGATSHVDVDELRAAGGGSDSERAE